MMSGNSYGIRMKFRRSCASLSKKSEIDQDASFGTRYRTSARQAYFASSQLIQGS